MMSNHNPKLKGDTELVEAERLVSLQTLARLTDAHATTVRRWLRDAEVQPVAIGRGRVGAIRYRWRDIATWLETLESVD